MSRIKVHFKDSKGNLLKTVDANEGDDLLSVAHEYDIDLEGTLFSVEVLVHTLTITLPPKNDLSYLPPPSYRPWNTMSVS